MRQRKIFIGVSLPNLVRKRLGEFIEKWQDSPPHQKMGAITLPEKQTDFGCGGLPVKWSRVENLHITVLFLGYVYDEKLLEICAATQKACQRARNFEVTLTDIMLGPKEDEGKLIWAIGEPDDNLKALRESIEINLNTYVRGKKDFRPHVTMGRIRRDKWLKLPEVPVVNKKINYVVPVDRIDIMESVLEKGKRKFIILESCQLK